MKLGYVILYVPDVVAAVAFYEAAFGLARRFVDESGSYAEMQTGGTALAFASEALIATMHGPVRANRPGEDPAAAEIAFIAEDVSAAYAQALAAGASALVAPHEKPWGQTVSMVRDLNGFLVELCSEIGS